MVEYRNKFPPPQSSSPASDLSPPASPVLPQTPVFAHAETGKVVETFTEAFEAIQARAEADRAGGKLKLDSERLFVLVPIKKETLSIKTKKENRSLNVQHRLRLMHEELKGMKNAAGEALFTPIEIDKILREYKLKLKEVKLSETQLAQGEIQVKDAASFLKYLRANKDSPRIARGVLTKLENAADALTERFKALDAQSVQREAGAEKAVYLQGDYAVATPRSDSGKRVLEKEYELTVKMRVNAMKKYFETLPGEQRPTEDGLQVITAQYQQALEDLDRPDIDNATSFLTSCTPKLLSAWGIPPDQARAVGAAIDKSLSGIDVVRKKIVKGDRVFYSSGRGMSDLKGFLKSPEMKNLNLTQFNELMESFEQMRSSMEHAGLLHGDIKPDNVFVYKEEIEGRPPRYTLKISDFGHGQVFEEGQFATAKQVHGGNARWHKGFYDTSKTQEMSLDMLKLIIINAGTRLQPKSQTEAEAATAHEKLLSRAPKVSDVAQDAIGLGGYMYRSGDTSAIGSGVRKIANLFRKTKKIEPKVKYNYFSNIDAPASKINPKAVTKSVFGTSVRAFFRDALHPGKNKRMERNTYHSALEFLDGVNAQFKPSTAEERASLLPKERLALLQKEQLHYTKIQTSFDLLQKMFPYVTLPPNFELAPLKGVKKKLKELEALIAAAQQDAAQPKEKLELPLPPDSPEEEEEAAAAAAALALEPPIPPPPLGTREPIPPPPPLGVEEPIPPPPPQKRAAKVASPAATAEPTATPTTPRAPTRQAPTRAEKMPPVKKTEPPPPPPFSGTSALPPL